ncbi:hypothetical protein C8R45DRAFT_942540 [Mycena sanguinolenta]|nr:hypothetical protein C8R45DRAFT_942540 [Mycena sanguinolenta]
MHAGALAGPEAQPSQLGLQHTPARARVARHDGACSDLTEWAVMLRSAGCHCRPFVAAVDTKGPDQRENFEKKVVVGLCVGALKSGEPRTQYNNHSGEAVNDVRWGRNVSGVAVVPSSAGDAAATRQKLHKIWHREGLAASHTQLLQLRHSQFQEDQNPVVVCEVDVHQRKGEMDNPREERGVEEERSADREGGESRISGQGKGRAGGYRSQDEGEGPGRVRISFVSGKDVLKRDRILHTSSLDLLYTVLAY